MGQKQNKSRDNNLIIEINPINNLTYEISLINNSKNYKALISESFMKDMLQIKNKSSLIQHIRDNNEISYKDSNSLILSFRLKDNKYQFQLYDIDDYKCIPYLTTNLDHVFLCLFFISLIRLSTEVKSSSYIFFRILHFFLIGVCTIFYGSYRYCQIFEYEECKFSYKEHFYYLSIFLIPLALNILCFLGCIFVKVNFFEKLFLLVCIGSELFIINQWCKEQFEKNTIRDIKKYVNELLKKLNNYINKVSDGHLKK